MRVLLTGAGGFIGAQVARALLERGAEVHAADLDPSRAERLEAIAGSLTLHAADLLDPAARARLVADAAPDVCVHAAWYAVPGKYLSAPENLAHVAASLDLAERLVHAGCKRLVGLGTCVEYDTSLGLPLTESSPTKPGFLYAASKLALHDILSAYAPLAKTSFAWCRVFYLYGPMEAPERLVRTSSTGCSAAASPRRPRARRFAISCTRPTWARPSRRSRSPTWRARSTSARERRSPCASSSGRSPGSARPRTAYASGAIAYRPGDPMHVLADVQKLRHAGFVPRFDLEAGLRDTVRDRRDRRDRRAPRGALG